MRGMLPRRITLQIALLLVLCVAFFHAAVFVILFSFGRFHPPRATDGALNAILALEAVPAGERPAIVSKISASLPDLDLTLASSPAPTIPATGLPVEVLREKLPAGVVVARRPDASEGFLVATLTDGQQVAFKAPLPPDGPSRVILISTLFVGISFLIFSLWAVVSLTRPLRRFADAAEAFTFNREAAPLDESGPTEVRLAAQAFNRMQVRISQMAARQARMLAAVSHDLRTPITRMRLHAEFLDDAEAKTKILRDLEQMDAMVHACLTYLRGSARREVSIVDLTSLLQTIADQFAEIGAEVPFSGPAERLAISANPDDLSRAFSNLVDNAIKFGGVAEIGLTRNGGAAIVEVRDRGPGIPPALRSAMLEPFERGDESRRKQAKDGFGLGLAITRAIVDSHGGTLELMNRAEGGLTVRITLPTVAMAAQTPAKTPAETI